MAAKDDYLRVTVTQLEMEHAPSRPPRHPPVLPLPITLMRAHKPTVSFTTRSANHGYGTNAGSTTQRRFRKSFATIISRSTYCTTVAFRPVSRKSTHGVKPDRTKRTRCSPISGSRPTISGADSATIFSRPSSTLPGRPIPAGAWSCAPAHWITRLRCPCIKSADLSRRDSRPSVSRIPANAAYCRRMQVPWAYERALALHQIKPGPSITG
jgi:hypothetical protein